MNDTFRSQFRLPSELADQLRDAADASGRSMNAEVVARLEQSFAAYIDKDLTSKMLNTEVQRLSEELRSLRAAASPVLAEVGHQVEEQVRQVMEVSGLSFEDALLLTVTRGAVQETDVPVVIVQVAKGTTLEEARSLMRAINEYAPNDASVFYEQTDVPKTRLLSSQADAAALVARSGKLPPK